MTFSVTRTATKMNVLKSASFVKTFAGRFGIGLVNGHLLDQVLKRSGIVPRIVHKELGTILRKTCCYNLQKADIPSSVQQLHCQGVN